MTELLIILYRRLSHAKRLAKRAYPNTRTSLLRDVMTIETAIALLEN